MSTLEAPTPNTENRDKLGRFGAGNTGGPGRPKGAGKARIDAAAAMVRRHGREHEHHLTEVLDALRIEAVAGGRDMVKAAELWLTYCADQPEKGPLVALNLNAPNGPPVPRLPDLAENLAGMLKIATERGIVEGGPKLEVLVEVIDTDAELEEFLS